MIVQFPTRDSVSIAKVGGKAASLIGLQQGGANVPPGVVLTTDFFAPWLERIEACSEWQAALSMLPANGRRQPDLATRTRLAEACNLVKDVARQSDFTPAQSKSLQAIWALGDGPFAIRSSSPEEDLSGASFAGQYETVLNTRRADVESAIRTCFASCMDSRVLLYKQEMKFPSLAPTIAVVVQEQVASEVAGVVFSMNPLTNDYDEILINASWGLGEALVSGDITPDSVVVNKVTGDVIEQRIGNKGGDRAALACLDAKQITGLCTEVKRIEALFDTPVDVEWAFSGGRLHVLQARPVTAYIPVAPELLTAPGAPRHLYLDGYLTDGITMSGPVSPMANEMMSYFMQLMLAWAVAPADRQRLHEYGVLLAGGRMYIDISAYLHLMGKGKALAKQAEVMDPTIAAIFTSPDLERYRPLEIPPHLRRLVLFAHVPRVLWRTRRAFLVVLRAMRKTEVFKAEFHTILTQFDAHVRRPIDFDRTVADTIHEDLMHAGTVTMDSSYPACMIFYIATFRLKALIDSGDTEQVHLVDALLGGYEDDMVINMGHALFDLAQLLPAEAFDDPDRLLRELHARTLPPAFLSQWDDFVFRYGHRGPLEMDLLHPRYGDAPELILQQIASIARAGGVFNPHDMLAKKVHNREDAYRRLLQLLPPRKARKLEKLYADVMAYSGAREIFKHHLTQLYHRFRKHLLQRAEQFVAEGRLERTTDIFQLAVSDVDRAHADAGLDLRETVAQQGAVFRRQQTQVRHFPLAMDSRGRLFRPQSRAIDVPAGTIAGTAVSPGIATGPVKVLNDPFEKEVEPGDVLVAVTTDPGWTPLFINAAAVILEIGGELQHGALVAREYGKPCVSGIADVTHQFEDGQIVEVDGNSGRVRIVTDNGSS